MRSKGKRGVHRPTPLPPTINSENVEQKNKVKGFLKYQPMKRPKTRQLPPHTKQKHRLFVSIANSPVVISKHEVIWNTSKMSFENKSKLNSK